MTPILTPEQVLERGGENAWVTLQARFAPRERKLVGVRPQCVFKPTRVQTPVSPVRFAFFDVLHEAGAEVFLEEGECARVGALLVFELCNEGEREELFETRVYGIALQASGEVGVSHVEGRL